MARRRRSDIGQEIKDFVQVFSAMSNALRRNGQKVNPLDVIRQGGAANSPGAAGLGGVQGDPLSPIGPGGSTRITPGAGGASGSGVAGGSTGGASAKLFVNAIYKDALAAGIPEPQARLAAAQAGLESRFGQSGLAQNANNLFGMKAGAGWGGPTVTMGTKEQNSDGSWRSEDAAWRKYTSTKDSLRDWWGRLQQKWPDAANAKDFNGAVAGLRAGQQGGYATDQQYGQKLNSVVSSIGGQQPSAPVQDAGTPAQNPSAQAIPTPPKRPDTTAAAQPQSFNNYIQQQSNPATAVTQGVDAQGKPVDQNAAIGKQSALPMPAQGDADVPPVEAAQVAEAPAEEPPVEEPPVEEIPIEPELDVAPAFAGGGIVRQRPDRVASAQPGVALPVDKGTRPGGGRTAQRAVSPGYAGGGPVYEEPAQGDYEEEDDTGGETQETAIPLPPRRPEEFSGENVPLPPTRPADLGAAPAPQAQPQAQPQAEQDPISGFLDGIGEALGGALSFISETFGFTQAQAAQAGRGALPATHNSGVAQGLQRLLSGEDAASPAAAAAVNNAIDPDGQLDAGLRNAAGINALYQYYVQRGEGGKAKQAAASLVMHLQGMAAQHGERAFQLMTQGKTEEAAKQLAAGYDLVPDGNKVEATKNPDGTFSVVQKDAGGQVLKTFSASPQQLLAAAVGLKNGTGYYQMLSEAAGVAKKGKGEEAPDPAFEQWQQSQGGGQALPPAGVTSGGNTGAQPGKPTLPQGYETMSDKHQRQVARKYHIDMAEWNAQQRKADKEEDHALSRKEKVEDRLETDKLARKRHDDQTAEGRAYSEQEDLRKRQLAVEAPEKPTAQNADQYDPAAVDTALWGDEATAARKPPQVREGMRQIFTGLKQYNHQGGYGDEQYKNAATLLVTPEGQGNDAGFQFDMPAKNDPYGRVKLTFSGEDMPETLYLPMPAFRQAMTLRGIAAQQAAQRQQALPAAKAQPHSFRPF